MVSFVNMQSEAQVEDGPTEEQLIASREERKRTGRYVAAGAAIFLSLLGIYQALLNGTPQYAALFAPAVIMFIYVLWILHSSRNQTARLLKLEEARAKAEEAAASRVTLCEELSNKNENRENPVEDCSTLSKVEEEKDTSKPEKTPLSAKSDKDLYNRSYSIA